MDKSGKRFVSLQAMKLSELQPGQTARILFVGGKGAFRKRILEMGFITPHIAWAAYETRARLLGILEQNIKAYIDGNPINVVN